MSLDLRARSTCCSSARKSHVPRGFIQNPCYVPLIRLRLPSLLEVNFVVTSEEIKMGLCLREKEMCNSFGYSNRRAPEQVSIHGCGMKSP